MKTNAINKEATKRQLTTLQNKFTSKDERREHLQLVYENESIISACDGVKIAVIYKNNYNFIGYEGLNEEYTNILKNVFVNAKSSLKEKIKVNVDRILLESALKFIKEEINLNKANKKDKKVMVNFTITENKLNINSFLFDEGYLEDYSPIVKFQTNKQIKANVETNYNKLPKHTYSFSVDSLLDSSSLCTTKTIDLYFNTSNVAPLLLFSDNVEVLLLPIRPIDIETMKQERKEEEEKEIQAEKESLELIANKNNIAYELVSQAEKAISNNEKVENVDITIYKDRYDSTTTSLILYLFKKYNINVPLKTQGWINSALCYIQPQNKENYTNKWTYSYLSKSANSTVFLKYLDRLVSAINPVSTITEELPECTNEELDHLFGKEKGYHDQLEKDKKIKLVKTDLHNRIQYGFHIKKQKGEITENKIISDGLKQVILKKYPSYNSSHSEKENTIFNISTPLMWLQCFITCNDYLVVVKENKRGEKTRETYKIVR